MVREITLYTSSPAPLPGFPLARKYEETCTTGRLTGVSGMEYQTAGSIGIKPEMRVRVYSGGRCKAEFAKVGKSIYKIYRQYPVGPRYTELYLSAWIDPFDLYEVELLGTPEGTGVFDLVEPNARRVQAAVKRVDLAENYAAGSHDPMEEIVFWLPDFQIFQNEQAIRFGGNEYRIVSAEVIGASMQLTGRRKV